jgi:hypothetical protein
MLFAVYSNGFNPNYLLEEDCFKITNLMDGLKHSALLNSVRITICGSDCQASAVVSFVSWFIYLCVLTLSVL